VPLAVAGIAELTQAAAFKTREGKPTGIAAIRRLPAATE
jgi:hypothetical protein